MQATGQGPAPGQSMLSKTAIQHLGDELTRLSDGLEKSGLVDYEMGVWEEEIIHCKPEGLDLFVAILADERSVLLQCREAANTGNEDSAPAGATRGSRKGVGNR